MPGKKKGKGKGGKNKGNKKPKRTPAPVPTCAIVEQPVIALLSSSEMKEDTLASMINENDAFNWRVAQIPGKGRGAVAKTDIKKGSIIVREMGCPWTVSHEKRRHHCANCTDLLARAPQNARGCPSCGYSFYCSMKCMKDHYLHHHVVCPVLRTLGETAPPVEGKEAVASKVEYPIDENLVLMLAGYISLRFRAYDKKDEGENSEQTALSFRAPLSALHAMSTHELSSTEQALVMETFQKVLSTLPVPLHPGILAITPDEVFTYISMVNANSHALNPSGIKDNQIGLGMFPAGAILNHSCIPNVAYIAQGVHNAFLALTDISAGTELCVSYSDLDAGYETRQQALLRSKHFQCECARCILQPGTEEEQRVCMNDIWLEAFHCIEPKCDGYYVGPRKSISESKEMNHTMEEYGCCVCGHLLNLDQLQELQRKLSLLIDKISAVTDSYTTARQAGKSMSKTFDALESVYKEALELVHPLHTCMNDTLVALVNCAGTIGDVAARVKYARELVARNDAYFPTCWLPAAAHYLVLSNTVGDVMKMKKNLPKKLETMYTQERIKALSRRADTLSIWYGENHSITKKANQQLQNV